MNDRVKEIEKKLNAKFSKYELRLENSIGADISYLINTIKQQQDLLEQLVGEESLHQQGIYETEMTRLNNKNKQQQAQIDKYEKALKFYADEDIYATNVLDQWEPVRRINNDAGKVARQALKEGE